MRDTSNVITSSVTRHALLVTYHKAMTEFLKLRTAEEAWDIFRASFAPIVRHGAVPGDRRAGSVLAQDATAPHDLPTFVRSTVDGYAVQAADTHGASPGCPPTWMSWPRCRWARAPTFVLEPGQAALMHTGGMVPEGADAVVMIEHTHRAGEPLFSGQFDRARTARGSLSRIEVYRPLASGEDCIQIGEDVRAGELVLPAGHTLRPQDIGGLLAVGITEVSVARQPTRGDRQPGG